MFNAILLILLGASIICLGAFAIKKPTSGFWRPAGLDKNSYPNKGYIEYLKFAGIFTIKLGSYLLLGGIIVLLATIPCFEQSSPRATQHFVK